MSRKSPKQNRQEEKMASALDALAEFQQFKDEILPELRDALKSGMSAEDLMKKYQAHAAARTITIMMRELDSSKALAAAKDIQDRSAGKAKERTEVEHKFAKLKDDELDSVLLSELGELTEDDSGTDSGTIQ
jgi:hypothetical protein